MRPAISISLILIATLAAFGQPVRNLIMMVPDGCDWTTVSLARWYASRDLTLDSILVGAVRTGSFNSAIPGSAEAATAFATGRRTTAAVLSIGPSPAELLPNRPIPESLQQRPWVTLLEAARLAGKATGIVVTSAVSHATPAAFYAHVPHRSLQDTIMKQLVFAGLDVVFGGGRRRLIPRQQGGSRRDNLDLRSILRRRGITVVGTAAGLDSLKRTPAWGLFADEHLAPDADRLRHAPAEPSLAAMTAKAIELLRTDPDGFFLLVEGSQVDWGAHANDPFYAVTELLAFDRAVRTALDFARRDRGTLLLVFSDHGCGGPSIGSRYARSDYIRTSPDSLLLPLRRMQLTSTGIAREIGASRTKARIRSTVQQWWDVELSDSALEDIHRLEAAGMDFEHALGEVFCRRYTVIGWTTHGHTGGDVPLWAYGPGSPSGMLDHTELARLAARALGIDLPRAESHVFIDLGRALGPDSWGVDGSDPDWPAVQIGRARLPIDTDLLIFDTDTLRLPGLTLLLPDGRAWVCDSALAVLRRR